MSLTIGGVTLVPSADQPIVPCATVTIDRDGVVVEIEPSESESSGWLVPAAVDLHLDNVRERRRPRATVELPLVDVIRMLDVECASNGTGTILVSARFEDEPRKGIVLGDALELCRTIEELHRSLVCDWYLHARVEVTDEGVVEALEDALALSTRVRLISMLDHSAGRSRFATREEHRQFYAADLGISLDEMDAIIDRKESLSKDAPSRRKLVAEIAARHAIALASHDDRTAREIDEAAALGAKIAEFPLTTAAARCARSHEMAIVLGAPNAMRGRSTSPGNLLVADAVREGICDVLCSDYLPSALLGAVFRLAEDGTAPLNRTVGLATAGARLVGLDTPTIAVGSPLTATLRRKTAHGGVVLALWRNGRLAYRRASLDAPRDFVAT